jgi:hypothetical protein
MHREVGIKRAALKDNSDTFAQILWAITRVEAQN